MSCFDRCAFSASVVVRLATSRIRAMMLASPVGRGISEIDSRFGAGVSAGGSGLASSSISRVGVVSKLLGVDNGESATSTHSSDACEESGSSQS